MPLPRRVLATFLVLPLAIGVGQAQWVQTNGLGSRSVYALAESGGYLFAGTYFSGNSTPGVFRTSDNGVSWTDVSNGLLSSVSSFVVSGGYLFAGAGSVYRTSDNGASWTSVGASAYSFAISGGYLFAGANGGVNRTSDNGASWSTVNNGLTSNYVTALAASGGILYAGTSGWGVFRSSDNGDSWIPVNNGLTNTRIQSLAVSGVDLIAGTCCGVFRSSDSGSSWTSNGLKTTGFSSFAVSGGDIFAGTDVGVFRASNSGNSWNQINNGLPSTVDVYSLAVSGGYLFAGTYTGTTNLGGVWRRPLSEIANPVPISPSHKTPVEFGFAGNGLVLPGAEIEFAIRQRGWVNLSVYDAKGNKAATLVNSVQAPGTHQATFNGAGLSGGIYFLRLRADGISRTKWFMLEK